MLHLQKVLVNFAQTSLAEKTRLLATYLEEKLAADLAEIHHLYDLNKFKELLVNAFKTAERKLDDVTECSINRRASEISTIPDQWDKIPFDKLWLIIQHLTPREFLLLGKVNQQFRSLTKSDYFWQQYGRIYGTEEPNKKAFVNGYISLFGQTNCEIDRFIHAIARRDEKTAAVLLECNAIQAYLRPKGQLLLLYIFIARYSSLKILRMVEVYFANENDLVKDFYKIFVLHFALKAGQKEICAYLRSSTSASPLAQELYKGLLKNPMHLAAAKGDMESLDHFIKHEYTVNSIINGYAPLHMAVLSGQQATVEWLLKNGADVNLETKKHDTSLGLALTMGHDGLAKFLLEHGAVLSADANETVLQKAVLCGCMQTIRYLQEKGHDISSLDEDGNSYLHQAALATRNSAPVVSLFIRYKLFVNQTNKNGQTPLHFAALEGHAAAIRELLSHGADISCDDVCGENAMHYAARSGDPDTLKLLLEHGLSAVQPNQDGETPLLLAVQHGHTASAQLLLDCLNFQTRTSRQSRHLICERLLTVLNTEKEVVESYKAFVLEETLHDPMGLALDVAEFKVALVRDNIDALAWESNLRKMLVKRLLSASAECFSEYRKSLPKMKANGGETDLALDQALCDLGSAIQEMQDENRKGDLPPRLAAAFYELSYAMTDSKKQAAEKLKAIEDFKAKILPSWWKIFGKILTCILWVAVGITAGFTIGFWAIAGCAWFGLMNLSTLSTLSSNILLGSLAASTAGSGVTAGILSSLWLFKVSPEEKLAKRLAKEANLLLEEQLPIVESIPIPCMV